MASTKTTIEWTDATWNPMTGCTKISAGCDHCYAATVAERKLRNVYLRQLPVKDTLANREDPFAPRFWPNRLDQPLVWKEPRRVFVNSMSDVFHAHFSLEQIRQVFEVMETAAWHQFQVLTKRPERALRYAKLLPWPENVWLGVSVETPAVFHRITTLQKVPANVRFISAEPLLEELAGIDLAGIRWVIGGGESGAGFRPCRPEWARSLRDSCASAGVAFFWKQWGGFTPKAGGRELDGRTWDDYPLQHPTANSALTA